MKNEKKTFETELEKELEKEPKKEEIEVGDPQILKPAELPLVVKLPKGASKAQIEYAKILNAYAYINPRKWKIKKDKLIAYLKELETAPDPEESEYGLKIAMKNPLG